MVIGGRIIQIIRLFSSLTVLSTDIVLISVILNAAESNADNAINNQKTRRELACFGCIYYRSNYYNVVII